jgi:hypothetical protein
MKYEKIVKIAVGIITVAIFFVGVNMVLADLSTPVVTSVAGGDGYINTAERSAFPISGTVTATTSASTLIINLYDGTNSATSTISLEAGTTTYATTTLSAATMDEGTVNIRVEVADGVATSSVLATTTTLDITAPTIASTTISSNNASTTLAKAGNIITLYATSSETVSTPSITFTSGGVAVAGTVTITNPSALAYKAVYTASSTDTAGAIGFSIGSFTDTAGNPTAASSTTLKPSTGTGVTFDKTAPTVSTVVWNAGTDTDGDTNISATDTIVVTFSEAMATTTATSTNIDTVLGLSGSHTFGTSPTATWTGLTILTITLGTDTTVASGDTITPTSAVTDATGNAFTSVVTTAITDAVAPVAPVSSLAAGTYTSTEAAILTSVGSSNIYYTIDGTTPSCTSGALYSTPITVERSITLKAVGCDAYSNESSVFSAAYTITRVGGSGGTSGRNPKAATPATPAVPGVSPATPAVPAHKALTAGSFSRDLFVGSEGDDVVTLQTFLEQSGYLTIPNGVAKGYFGGLTKAAVKKFQKDVGLPTPGRVGPATRGILNKGQ